MRNPCQFRQSDEDVPEDEWNRVLAVAEDWYSAGHCRSCSVFSIRAVIILVIKSQINEGEGFIYKYPN
jgi:hypothetical protein